MACNCGRRRIQATSANVAAQNTQTTQTSSTSSTTQTPAMSSRDRLATRRERAAAIVAAAKLNPEK